MARETRQQRADGLIIGSAGPFYVALNHAAFYLVVIIFFIAAPIVVFVLRDAGSLVRVVVAGGIAMETGTIVHIWLERVRGWRGAAPWVIHGGVAGAVFAAILLFALAS